MTEARVTEGPAGDPADPVFAEPREVAATSEPSTPGSVLRKAREARGQSIADVVQVIRFSSRQIEALERDDYASLPGSTAVRGLVRNYAKFLKLDAAPLLAKLDPAVPVPEADVRPPANMGEAEQATIAERVRPRMAAVWAVILVLALAGYWYSSGSGDGGQPGLPRAASSGSGAVSGSNSVAVPAAVPVVAPVPAVVAPLAENAPAGAGPVSGTPPSGGLRIEFDDLSWIEVRDATQKIVFVGEYPAGTRQNVEGKAPFQVWIGKSSGVRVFMGERSIDLKPHTREDIARFSLE
jgi:cytoskeleton protein RodZ